MGAVLFREIDVEQLPWLCAHHHAEQQMLIDLALGVAAWGSAASICVCVVPIVSPRISTGSAAGAADTSIRTAAARATARCMGILSRRGPS